jgi:hypothetical protein
MGSPLVGREEDGVERYHFVHCDGVVTRSCTGIRRMWRALGKLAKKRNYGWCVD